MNEPPDRRWLDALRRDREAAAPDDAQARVAARLRVLGPFSAAPPPAATAPLRAGERARWLPRLTGAFVVGGAAGALLHAGVATVPAPRVVYVDRAVPVVPIHPLPSALAPIALPPHPADSALAPTVTATPALATPPRPATRPAQLDAERALLDAARGALINGESETALDALARHTRTYAHPLLGEEREALFVQALVRAGRYDDARARAEAFRQRAPQSLFLPAVEAAVASIP